MSPHKGKTAVHDCHCWGDMDVCLHKVMPIPRTSWYVCFSADVGKKPSYTTPFDALTFDILTQETVFQDAGGIVGGLRYLKKRLPRLSSSLFPLLPHFFHPCLLAFYTRPYWSISNKLRLNSVRTKLFKGKKIYTEFLSYEKTYPKSLGWTTYACQVSKNVTEILTGFCWTTDLILIAHLLLG